MLYGQLIDELIERMGLNEDDADRRAVAGRKINNAYKEIANNTNVDWKQLEKYGEIVTVPNYTTGTCTITNGSRTVTGAGTVFTSAMEGRFFKPERSSNWYRIVRVVSGTELTLFSSIIEDSGSGKTFTIWKRWYYLPSEVRRVLEFGSWIRDGKLTERSSQWLADGNPDMSNTGEPVEFSMFGVDPYTSEYTSGSNVTVTENSTLMTGVGTEWLSNVEPGDIVQISSQVLRVKRVESDTRIRLLNYATATITPESYKIQKNGNIGFQLWFNPNRQYILPFYYIKRAYDMVNETYDMPELPEDFDKAILDNAEADYLSSKKDSDWVNKQNLASARINDLKTNRYVSTPRNRQMRPLIPERGEYI
jgi:hypothetical protein